MADEEQTEVVETEVENPAPDETTETPNDMKADGEVEGEAETEAEAETEGEPEGEETEGETEVEGEAAFKPNVVFKAGVYNKDTKQLEQKEYTIDPKYAALMTDAESEKQVRELHEKAFGLDSVKERYNEQKMQNTQVVSENSEIKSSINKVRSIYNGAVKTGNWHKLDDFFAALDIPQENIMKYALEKVKLAEMDPAARQAVLSQLDADRRAESLQQERDSVTTEKATLAQQNVALQVDFVLAKPEVAALAAEFDKRAGQPGAFKQAVYREGNLAWTNGEELPPHEAAQRVIKNYGLTGSGTAPAAQTPAPGQAAPKKPVVQRTTQTIPNIGSRNASPLPSKPKNLDEVLKYRKETHGF